MINVVILEMDGTQQTGRPPHSCINTYISKMHTNVCQSAELEAHAVTDGTWQG